MAKPARSDALLVDDAEVARRLGLTPAEWDRAARVFAKAGFPVACPVTHRHYWPAIQVWLDQHYGLTSMRPAAAAVATKPDGEENPDALKPRRRARA